ncbi:MAG: hypothetical protein ACYTGA_07925 [Planctomycetota bacterium]
MKTIRETLNGIGCFKWTQSKNTLFLNDPDRSWLTQMGLATFEQLMFTDIGRVIQKDHKSDVRLIEGFGRTVYLKRHLITPIKESVEKYVLDRCAYSVPFTEHLYMCSLRQFQFPVMDCIAAGEQRRLGFPCFGFILVDEVKGTRLDEALGLTDTQDKDVQLLQSFGKLLAELHQHGFYAQLRLKDMIVTDTNAPSLVMIDRENRHPQPSRRSKIKARQSLDRSFRRIERDSPAFNEDHKNIVMQSYRNHSGASRVAQK